MLQRFKGQPRGVYPMCLTEVWERFAYYGFIGTLTLFMVSKPSNGGLSYARNDAMMLFGVITGLIWIAPMIGGWLADRHIGPRRAAMFGCTGLESGNFLMMLSSMAAIKGATWHFGALLAAGVSTMIVGAGFLKLARPHC